MSATTLSTYQLKIKGHLDGDFVTTFCPAGTIGERRGECTVLAGISTDQSGIIGMLRHLHNLGCTILEMTSKQEEPYANETPLAP